MEYISDLLFIHDCVIIPGFGGFICNDRSARIDAESGRICPPGKEIRFNRSLNSNDGLLANWIACKEHMAYERACSLVNLFSEELKIRLNQGERVRFGQIGEFRADRHANIIFEAFPDNFYAVSVGMDDIILDPKTVLLPARPEEVHRTVPRNLVHRLLKYALAAACVSGVLVIARQDLPEGSRNEGPAAIRSNLAGFQPSSGLDRHSCTSVISPEEDYVDYDPLNDLGILK